MTTAGFTDTAPPDAAPLDPSVLDQHKAELGEETVRAIISRFLDTAPATLRLIAAAAEAGELAPLGAQAHKLGSAALTLGLPALARLARSVEHQAKAGDEAALVAAREMPAAMDQAVAALDRYLALQG